MSRAHIYVGFSDDGFYDHFESTADSFEFPLVNSEIIYGTMVFR